MPSQLKENIKGVQLVPIQTLTSSGIEGDAVDTKLSEMFSFDTALIAIEIGAVTGIVTVKIEESDDSTFLDETETVAEGGEVITVVADHSYKMEIARTKRYLRAVVTVGTSAVIYIGGLLCNWAKPFPIL